MARGKDAPTERGGQLDPYVQQSLLQSREMSENRVAAAMREAGASSRQKQAGQQGMMQQGIQMGADIYQAAAERKQQEEQFAAMEEGKRQDRILTETISKAQMRLDKEIADAQLAEQQAAREQAHEDREKALRRAEAARKAKLMVDARNNFTWMNAIMTLAKARYGAEKARQIFISNAVQQEDDAQQNAGIYDQAVERVGREVANDKRMDMPPQGEFEAVMRTRPGEFGAHYEMVKKEDGDRASPGDVINAQLKKEESKMDLGDMVSPESIRHRISKGEVDSQDIAISRAVVDAMIPVFDEKAKAASEKQWRGYTKKYNDKMYWDDQVKMLRNIKINFTRLTYDKTPVQGNKNITVGSVLATGLGPIDNIDFGSSVLKIMAQGGDYGNVFDEYTKAVDGYAPIEITPDMDEDLVEELTFVNSIYEDGRNLAMKASGETTPVAADNWGAD